MATWKKVIVSGSSAHLTGITSSVLTANNILQAGTGGAIQNSGITLSGNTLALGANSITSTGTNSVLTGSFAGTFSGSLSVNLQDLTNGTGISAFTYDGNSPATVAVSGASALSSNTLTKWTGNAFANTTITDDGSRITTTTPLTVGGAITASGDIIPGTNNTFVLGKAGSKWNSLYVENIIAQGNLTIGDSLTDTIEFISRISSSFVPNNNNVWDLGQSATRWQTLYVNNISASGNISSSAGLIGATLTTSGNGTIGGTLNVTSTTTLTGALTVNSTISASGNISGSTLRIVGNESIGGNSTIAGTLDVTGTTTLAGNLLANGNTTLGNATTDTLIISGSSISVPSIAAGSTDTVIIRTATNELATRTIDNRVWGSTLVDASGTPVANQVPYWTDANTLAGEAGFTYNPSTDVFTAPNVIVTSNLTVQGTASFQQTTNLEVADRFILLASGSNTAGEGGIVVQQATQNVGEIFGWDNDASRWAVTSSFTANQSSFIPDAFMAAVTTAAGTTPSVAARYSAVGNIYVSTGDESIWIYS